MNTMATLPRVLALMLMLLTALPAFGGMEKDDSAPDYDAKELEQRLTEARQQLDAAARKLAELNRVKYSKIGAKGNKAMLGIVIDDYGQEGGLRLHGLTPGGGAAAAGLKVGDRLLQVNGLDLGTEGRSPAGNLSKTMKTVEPGESVAVRYARKGQEYTADIVTRAHHRDMMAMMEELEHRLNVDIDLDGLDEGLVAAAEGVAISAAALASVDGMELSNSRVIKLKNTPPRLVALDENLGSYFGVDAGVLVVDAPAGAGDIRSGDVLLSLDGQPMTDVGVAHALLAQANGRELSAKVRRQGSERGVQINADAFNKTERLVRTIRIEGHGDDMQIIVEEDD
ncbi:MAG: PDZ domain-containing protein [Pseudomonadales bacterium]